MNNSKQMDKPSFAAKLIRYLAISLIVCIAVSTAFVSIQADRFHKEKQAEFDYYLSSLTTELERAIDQYKPTVVMMSFTADVKYKLCEMYERYGVSSKFYVNDNEVADSGETVFIQKMINDRNKVYMIPNMEILAGFDEYSGGKYYQENAGNVYRIALRKYYIHPSNRRFIPEQIEIWYTDPASGQVQLVDYYEVADSSHSGYATNSETGSLAEMPCLIRIGDKGISSDYSLENLHSSGNAAIINTISHSSTENYRTVLILSEYQVPSYFNENITSVFLYYGIAVIVAGLFSVISAYIRYTKEKSIYDMIEYRRKTTNAMAHDLKTPLAAISAYAENLEQDIDGDKREYYSYKIVENVVVMNRMIEEILQFSKSEVKANISLKDDVDVGALVEEISGEVKPLFDDNHVLLRVMSDSKITLRTDRALLKQSLINLLTNAAKYSSPATETEVVIARNKVTVRNSTDLEINDVNRLKEPFVKGHDSRGEKDGTGLGLSIADNNLNMLGYKLELGFEKGVFTATVVF